MSLDTSNLQTATQTEAPAVPRRNAAPWIWATIGCLMLGTSGVVRGLQESRHQSEKSYKESCPIDVAKMPKRLGDWKLVEGGEQKLDPFTMRIAGGTDHTIQTYSNEYTGVSLTILVLFGPADPVLPHHPQICYPTAGFTETEAPALRTIEYPTGQDSEGRTTTGRADFLSAAYMKPAGRSALREAVYHSFRLDGLWSPYIGSGRKFPRRNPGIFKVQVQRLTAEGESIGQGDPIEQFLMKFLPLIESQIKASSVPTGIAKATPTP